MGKSIIVFTRTVAHAQRTALLARILGFNAVPLHGQLSQSQRLGSLNKFKSNQANILVATDVAARGLDIPSVDVVINYDIPTDSKAYIHRVGRTARAGRSGKSISLITQYDLEMYLRIESVLGKNCLKRINHQKKYWMHYMFMLIRQQLKQLDKLKKFMIKEMVVVVEEEIEMMPIEKKDKPHSKKITSYYHIKLCRYL